MKIDNPNPQKIGDPVSADTLQGRVVNGQPTTKPSVCLVNSGVNKEDTPSQPVARTRPLHRPPKEKHAIRLNRAALHAAVDAYYDKVVELTEPTLATRPLVTPDKPNDIDAAKAKRELQRLGLGAKR